MTERQMELLEILAVIIFLLALAAAVMWGNHIGIERMNG